MVIVIIVETFQPHRSNTLFGFCTIVVVKMHMRIHGVTVHESHGKRWASLPSKPMLDKAGNVLRDERGKVRYSPVLEFTDKETRDRFSTVVIDALLEFAPGAFEVEEV